MDHGPKPPGDDADDRRTPFFLAVDVVSLSLYLVVCVGAVLAGAAACLLVLVLVDPWAGLLSAGLCAWLAVSGAKEGVHRVYRWATRTAVRAVGVAEAAATWVAHMGTATVVCETDVYGVHERIEFPGMLPDADVLIRRATVSVPDDD